MKAMKYLNGAALVAAVVWAAGCASAPRVVVADPVGPVPTGASQGAGDGMLVIYSARTPAEVDVYMADWRWNNDFGRNEFLYERSHTGYTVYSLNGQVVKQVRNARSADDELPTLVSLPAGAYKVETQGINCDSDRVALLIPVVIKAGETTMAHVDGSWNALPGERETELAKLPCGRVIGWRAPEAGFAATMPASH
jgi:hypothetical protein